MLCHIKVICFSLISVRNNLIIRIKSWQCRFIKTIDMLQLDFFLF